jgi:hypothetical protein
MSVRTGKSVTIMKPDRLAAARRIHGDRGPKWPAGLSEWVERAGGDEWQLASLAGAFAEHRVQSLKTRVPGESVLAAPLEWKSNLLIRHAVVGPYTARIYSSGAGVVNRWSVTTGAGEVGAPCASLEAGDEAVRAWIAEHLRKAKLLP